MTIWHVLTGEPMKRGWWASPPLDPADLLRCVKLLDRYPAWRARLPEVADLYPEWTGLVEEWPRLEAMLRAELKRTPGIAPDTYDAMREIEASALASGGR